MYEFTVNLLGTFKWNSHKTRAKLQSRLKSTATNYNRQINSIIMCVREPHLLHTVLSFASSIFFLIIAICPFNLINVYFSFHFVAGKFWAYAVASKDHELKYSITLFQVIGYKPSNNSDYPTLKHKWQSERAHRQRQFTANDVINKRHRSRHSLF